MKPWFVNKPFLCEQKSPDVCETKISDPTQGRAVSR
jgi:hypothetical protein